MTDYKDTLNLPQTEFPMKANLPAREPERLAKWQSLKLYDLLRQARAKAPKFVLHDGPPYANGNIHLGTALNKILKDIVMKSKTLSGFNTPYVPGWDCHGLPIELNVEKKFGKAGDKLSAREFRTACRDYASAQVEIQKADFQRLGILGDWENPYLTMHSRYEANAVRALAEMVEKGHLHRGQKPVHWCTACGSALAEAEVEYRDKTSPAIDVAFDVADVQQCIEKFFHEKKTTQPTINKISVIIWTTTPWTLPANEAISVHPDCEYALVTVNHHAYIVADALVQAVMTRLGLSDYKIISKTLGKNCENIVVQHPFLDRQVPIILGEHVTMEAGTGCVHTAPAHGQDDYVIGQRYHLPMKNPVNAKSCFDNDVPLVGGMHVFKANEPIMEALKKSGHLLHAETTQHSYPHCWRHKTPLIFRATPQWFISMSQKNLRKTALEEIKKVTWIPAWGQERITKMIETRPDWCISRQRAWGIPITLFVHETSGALHPNTLDLMQQAADLIEKEGIDAWHEADAKDFIGDEKNYRKVTDVLDVWFDSGVTHACVLAVRPELSVPADLYLEGSDQHRGWFQSSLLTSVAMRDHAPFRAVLTHGYVVDGQGRKMSKSIGNTILPADVVKKDGADILRLWAMATDHTDDISVSDEILKRSSDAYRRIRNTMRFLLSNLFDFDPAKNLVDPKNLVMLDAWIIARAQQCQEKIIAAYDAYQFPAIYQAINNFCILDLGSFYLDIIKDRQYTSATEGFPRRSAQTALYYLLEMMVRWLAHIISFTADEIWELMPGQRDVSVFLTQWFTDIPALPKQSDLWWQSLITIRNDANKILETLRADGKIGSALDAEIILHTPAELYNSLKNYADELRFFFIVSDVALEKSRDEKITIDVRVTQHKKCERCWQRRHDVGKHSEHKTICGRCVENVFGHGEKRSFA